MKSIRLFLFLAFIQPFFGLTVYPPALPEEYEKEETLGLRISVFLPENQPDQELELYYSSAFIYGHRTPAIFSTRGLKRGVWTDWDLWFSHCKKTKEYPLLKPFELNGNYARVQWILPSKEDAWDRARKLYPSYFDDFWGQISLSVVFCLCVLMVIARSRQQISIKLFGGFSAIFLSSFLYFLLYRIPPFQNLEQSRLNEIKTLMQTQLSTLIGGFDQSEAVFSKDLGELQDKISQYLKSMPSLQNLTTQSALRELPLLRKDPGLKFIIYCGEIYGDNDPKLYASDQDFADVGVRQSHVKDMYPMLIPLFREQSKDDKQKKIDHARKGLAVVKEFLQGGISSSLKLEAIFYNPGKLLELFVTDMDVYKMFRIGSQERFFWNYLGNFHGKEFLIIGSIYEDYLLRFLWSHIESTLKNNSLGLKDWQWLLNGRAKSGPWPQESQNISPLFALNRLADSSNDLEFRLDFQNQKPRFFIAQRYLPLKTHVLSLSVSAHPFFNALKETKNQIFMTIFAFLGLSFLVALIFARAVTRPLLELRQGLSRVARGDLSQFLPVRTRNQFAEMANLFNQMIVGLREKEFMARFLSRMALQALDTEGHETVRESVTVIYCGFKNIHDLQSACGERESVHLLNLVLCDLQSKVGQHHGSVDKFTGTASLCLFRSPHDTEEPFLAVAAFRDWLHEFNQTREADGLIPVIASIGMAHGSVILGHVGASKRKDFTCIGNTVNMSARLGSIKPPEGEWLNIHLESGLYALVAQDRTKTFINKGEVSIKGKKDAQIIYQFI